MPTPDHPFREEILPNIQSKPSLVQLEAISSCPISWYLGKETNPHLATTCRRKKSHISLSINSYHSQKLLAQSLQKSPTVLICFIHFQYTKFNFLIFLHSYSLPCTRVVSAQASDLPQPSVKGLQRVFT